MEAVYNELLKGWQIVYSRRWWTRPEIWNTPVNDKIYESQAEAWHILDKWGS